MASVLPIIHSRWNHNFGNLPISSMEFYNKVEEKVKLHEIPKIEFSRVTFSQAGLFSAKREYLRISRNNLSFDICAAPFGKDFFISYWYGERVGMIKEMIARIPKVGPFLVRMSELKTYYQVDTENMFSGSVHAGFLEAVDEITTSKGIRGLTELERLPKDLERKQ